MPHSAWLSTLKNFISGEGKRTNAYSALRKLEPGGHTKQNTFTLPEHADKGYSPSQSAERLAQYFSKISQEFDPINPDIFPPWIRQRLREGKDDISKPVLEEWQVHKKLSKSKKPNFLIPGDLPVKIVKEFTPELAKPATLIYNKITQSGIYPRQWIVEHQIAIPKVATPQTEDDLRNLAGTAYLSKQYESFLGDWILPFIYPYIDPAQCGGLKGSSITHYLIKLLHFIHINLDKTEPHAVLLALIDLEKAFNKVSHQLLIEDLADMHVPGWLLLILISYLTGRSMYMKYKGASSTQKLLPGSSPQGAFLGVLIFIIIFNGALLRPKIPRPYLLTLKYIDDLSILIALNLKQKLFLNSSSSEYIIPATENPLQQQLDDLHVFTTRKYMKIKESKSHVMKFNFSKNLDFTPKIQVNGFKNNLEVIKETKLLGIMISSDLKWDCNTEYICKKAYKRMWSLRRMKILDIEPLVILDVYLKEIRSVLELAVPAWHSGITVKQSKDIERVQKVAVKIILSNSLTGRCDMPYDMALVILNLEPLFVRREKLCEKFAKDTLKSRHSDIFKPNPSDYNTRNKLKYKEYKSNTLRCHNSPINYLTRLLNS